MAAADEVWAWTEAERLRLADLLEELHDDEWNAPSLCEGWRVRDVAAHVTLSTRIRPAHALAGVVRAAGRFNRYVADDARHRARREPAQLVADLRAAASSRTHPVGLTPLDPLADILVHTQDIALAIGREVPMHAEASAAAATRIWTMVPFPFWAKRRARGISLRATDADWSVGSGAEVSGPAGAILLALTGRASGLSRLDGPGLETYARHFPTADAL